MGTKKCLLCFETHVFHSQELLSTRRWAIDSDGVARLVEISPVVKVVLLAMCFLVFALCLVGYNSRLDLSLSDNDSVPFCHLQPGTALNLQVYVSGVFPQSGFPLHSSFAEIFRRTEVVFIDVLHTVVVQKTLFRNSPVNWPFKYDATHAHIEQIETGLLFFVVVVYNIILTFKRHNFTDQLVSWICTSQTFGGRFKHDLPFVNKTSLSAVVLDRYDLKWILRNFHPSFHLNYRLRYGIFNVCYLGGLYMLLFS